MRPRRFTSGLGRRLGGSAAGNAADAADAADAAHDAGPDASDTPFAAEPPTRRANRFIRLAVYVAALVLIFVVGWLGSALWFSPAPLLPEERTVPRVLELPLEDAREALGRTELRARVDERRPHPSIPRGVVLWQDPAPNMVVPMNTVVQLTTSAGPANIPVPDLSGLAARDAAAVLAAAGLRVGEIDTVGAAGEPNVVLGTRPRAGTGRSRGSDVGLIVTAGGEPAGRTRP